MTVCPTPQKRAYLTIHSAAGAALDMLEDFGPQRPYQCECDRYHLTTRPIRIAEPLDAAMVRRLAFALGLS